MLASMNVTEETHSDNSIESHFKDPIYDVAKKTHEKNMENVHTVHDNRDSFVSQDSQTYPKKRSPVEQAPSAQATQDQAHHSQGTKGQTSLLQVREHSHNMAHNKSSQLNGNLGEKAGEIQSAGSWTGNESWDTSQQVNGDTFMEAREFFKRGN